MKEYNKEKLHEYAKELFALCLDKGIIYEYYSKDKQFVLYLNNDLFKTYFSKQSYLARSKKVFNEGLNVMPIWELIEKVKQL